MNLKTYKESVKKDNLIPRTLMFLRKENTVLLGKKLRGVGAGNLVGVGGTVEKGETFEDAAIRETYEEIGVKVKDIKLICHLFYYHVPYKGSYIEQEVKAYEAWEWTGRIRRTPEIIPQWFSLAKIPLDKMWDDDYYWLLPALNGKRLVASLLFDKNAKVIESHLVTR